MAFNFLKSLDADDIFISYSRGDGSAYLTGLDAALSARGFSCFTDKRGTDADRLPPKTLFRKIRLCKTLVLLGTPGALGKPDNITPELKEFAEANGTSRIVCVSFDRGTEFADWPKAWDSYVVGKAREREDPDALKTGKPSPAVVETAAAASDYMKSKDRLRKYRNRALGVLAGLVVAIIVAAVLAAFMFKRADAATVKANAETERAAQATRDAAQALAQAQAAQAEARTAKAEADTAKADATEQKRLADLAAQDAKEKARLADAATRKAQAAETRAAAEQERADREKTIADVRSRANQSQTLLRQRPEEVRQSLSRALEAMQLSDSKKMHILEADTALRESLALFPRFRSNVRYLSASAAALSPDGRHFATVESDKKLHVYALGNQTPLYTRDCECSTIALSSGAAYAAAIMNGGGVKIFDLKDDARSRLLPLPDGISPENVALSPGGRYLALTADFGESEGRHSTLLVLEAASGKVVKSFDDYVDTPGDRADASGEGEAAVKHEKDIATGACGNLNMLIHAVAFGPSGNLAVGGKYNSPQGGRFAGRVVFWPLRLDTPDMEAEGELNDASFTNQEVVQQAAEVMAVSPGADDTSFATDKGVWKRMSGRTAYEPIARLSASPYDESNEIDQVEFIKKLALSPDGRTLEVVKDKLGDSGDSRGVALEVWDATGHRDAASAYHEKEVMHVGFKPGGESVITNGEAGLHVFQTDSGAEAGNPLVEPDSTGGQNVFISPYTGDLVIADDETVTVWGVWEKRRRTVRFGPALSAVVAAALSPDARFLALAGPAGAGNEQTVVVYRSDGDTYSKWKELPPNAVVHETPRDKPTEVSVSADGRFVAVHYVEFPLSPSTKDYIRVFNVAAGRDVTPKVIKEFHDPKLMALSPIGQYLAVTQLGHKAYLVNLSTGRMDELLGDTEIISLAFSPDGRYLGLGSDEGILHVFESARPNDEIARLQHTGKVTAVAFSDDDRHVATASSDPHPYRLNEEESYPVRVWLLQPSNLLAEAQARLDSLRRPIR